MKLLQMNFLRLAAIGCLTFGSSAAWAAGSVAYTTGEVSVFNKDNEPRGVRKGDRIVDGETIITGRDGELMLTTDDSGVLALRPRSRLLIETYQVKGDDKDSVVLNLLRGSLRSITGWISKSAPSNYKMRTRVATVGIRGTDHETAIVDEVVNGGTWNQVTEGTTTLSTPAGTLTQVAGAASATSRVRSKDAAPEAARPPEDIFFKRATDAIVDQLRDDAKQNQAERLKTRQQQLAASGYLSAQGNPRISTQCTSDSAAQRVLDELLRAYERGDIAALQARLDPKMLGYGTLLNDLMTSNNVQRQTRLQILDKQMQCGADIASINFAWKKYFLNSTNFAPVVQEGRSAVLISGLGGSGKPMINGIAGDALFKPPVVAVVVKPPVTNDGSIIATPSSVSFAASPSGCATPTAPPVSGSVVVTANASSAARALVSRPSTQSPTTCLVEPGVVPYTCNATAAGASATATGSPSGFSPLSCSATFAAIAVSPGIAVGAVSATGNLNFTGSGNATFSGQPGSSVSVSVPIQPSALGSATGSIQTPVGTTAVTATVNGTAPSVTCTVTVNIPAGAAPAPVCTGATSIVNATIEVRDADVTAAAVQVEIQASNGDAETLTLPQVSPGVYRVTQLSVRRGATAVTPGNGAIDLVGATPASVTLTIRYNDAKGANGAPAVRQTTLLLTP